MKNFLFALLLVLTITSGMTLSGCERSREIINPLVAEDVIVRDTGDIHLLPPPPVQPAVENGIVWVQYDVITSQQADIEDDIPVAVVNEFLTEKGYTPRVLNTLLTHEGTVIEVIYVGSEIDTSPLFEPLQTLEGVTQAAPRIITHCVPDGFSECPF